MSRALARLSVLALAMALPAFAMEVGLRVLYPCSFVLERDSDAFYRHVFAERLSAGLRSAPEDRVVERHPQLGWRNRPLLRFPGYSTNSRGARGIPEYAVERTPGRGRIVVLGDSMTYGLGVADDATFASRLEQRLPGVEVINLGVNGYATDQQYLIWLEEGRRYAPDTAILVFYTDDFDRNLNRFRELPKPYFELEGATLVLRGVPTMTEQELLAEASQVRGCGLRLPKLLGRAWGRLRTSSDARFDEKARLLRALIEALHESCTADGVRLFVISLPRLYRRHPDDERIQLELRSVADRLRIPVLFLDREPPFSDPRSASPAVIIEDGHLSDVGHSAAAERILSFLRAENAVPAAEVAQPANPTAELRR